MKRKILAQTVIEYFIIFTLLIAVILSSGIFFPKGGRIHQIFNDYFNQAAEAMR